MQCGRLNLRALYGILAASKKIEKDPAASSAAKGDSRGAVTATADQRYAAAWEGWYCCCGWVSVVVAVDLSLTRSLIPSFAHSLSHTPPLIWPCLCPCHHSCYHNAACIRCRISSAVTTTGAPVISTQDLAVNKELIAVGREQLQAMADTCRTHGDGSSGVLMDAAVAVL